MPKPSIREIVAPAGARFCCFSLAEAPSTKDWSPLDRAESARAWRFAFDRDSPRHVLAHAATRRLLGAALGLKVESLVFTADALGKPALAGSASNLHFNLSHGGEFGALVVSANRPVGIDIEPWRAMTDTMAVGASVYAAREMQGWAQAPVAEVDARFLRLWTRKEALLKAIGLGLSLDPSGLEVGLEQTHCAVELHAGAQRCAASVASLEHYTDAALAVSWL